MPATVLIMKNSKIFKEALFDMERKWNGTFKFLEMLESIILKNTENPFEL